MTRLQYAFGSVQYRVHAFWKQLLFRAWGRPTCSWHLTTPQPDCSQNHYDRYDHEVAGFRRRTFSYGETTRLPSNADGNLGQQALITIRMKAKQAGGG